MSVLSSHPLSEERLATMKKAEISAAGAEILSAKEWRALRNICHELKSRK